MNKIEQVSVLGAGVIGASWTALFLANDLTVKVYDPSKQAQKTVNDYLIKAWPLLRRLGIASKDKPSSPIFTTCAKDAVKDSQFIQENVPEQLNIKLQLYQEIEPAIHPSAIVASSASGLMLQQMQQGFNNPGRLILGHPFNPPHLIPLVELLANEHTQPGVLEQAELFYQSLGKVTIRVKREVPAHVANRLQAALWKEAISLVKNGVASVEDVDKAVWAGPGLRWAAMGPHLLFHLGAGEGGIKEFCNRYKDSFHHWWQDLADIELNQEVGSMLESGVVEETSDLTINNAANLRDELIVSMLLSTQQLRRPRH